jgi:hypothetical protein
MYALWILSANGDLQMPLIAQTDGKDVPIRVLFDKNSSNEAYLLF